MTRSLPNVVPTAETLRESAEQDRESAEAERAEKEVERGRKEKGRSMAEGRRVSAEDVRVMAEDARSTADEARRIAQEALAIAESRSQEIEELRTVVREQELIMSDLRSRVMRLGRPSAADPGITGNRVTDSPENGEEVVPRHPS